MVFIKAVLLTLLVFVLFLAGPLLVPLAIGLVVFIVIYSLLKENEEGEP